MYYLKTVPLDPHVLNKSPIYIINNLSYDRWHLYSLYYHHHDGLTHTTINHCCTNVAVNNCDTIGTQIWLCLPSIMYYSQPLNQVQESASNEVRAACSATSRRCQVPMNFHRGHGYHRTENLHQRPTHNWSRIRVTHSNPWNGLCYCDPWSSTYVVESMEDRRTERWCWAWLRKWGWLRSCVNRWLVCASIRESRTRIWSSWMHFHWTWWVHNINNNIILPLCFVTD